MEFIWGAIGFTLGTMAVWGFLRVWPARMYKGEYPVEAVEYYKVPSTVRVISSSDEADYGAGVEGLSSGALLGEERGMEAVPGVGPPPMGDTEAAHRALSSTGSNTEGPNAEGAIEGANTDARRQALIERLAHRANDVEGDEG